MTAATIESGYAAINGAQIYYEIAGTGPGLVMIHAGVCDCRQWNHEFAHFSQSYRVLRYDLRNFGRTEPVEGEFQDLADLRALLDHLSFPQAAVFIGCSMGGGLALDLALSSPAQVKALVMVGSGPNGLELDVPEPDEFREAEAAFQSNDLDRIAEIETHIWFDGIGRSPDHINPAARKLAYEMNHRALSLGLRDIGNRLPDTQVRAAERLAELAIPVLVVVGSYDIPYMHAAADYMARHIKAARIARIENAAHLPNMDEPEAFRQIVEAFLNDVD